MSDSKAPSVRGWYPVEGTPDTWQFSSGREWGMTLRGADLRRLRENDNAAPEVHAPIYGTPDGAPDDAGTSKQSAATRIVAVVLVVALVVAGGVALVASMKSHPSPYEAQIRAALVDHGATITSVTEQSESTTVVNTDLNALDELDQGAAFGICALLQAAALPDGLAVVIVKSSGGNALTTRLVDD